MTLQDTNGGAASVDLDILAVKALMKQERPREGQPSDLPARAAKRTTSEVVSAETEERSDASGAPNAEPVIRKKRRLHPRHVLGLALLACLVLRPSVAIWILVALISPIILLFIFLCCVGVDGFWFRTRSFYLRIKARNPALAKRMRKGFYAGAARWDAIMDRLPGKMPEAAYVPDFQAAHAAELAHQRALEKRFDRLRDELGA